MEVRVLSAALRRPLLILVAALLVVPATASAKLTRLPGTGETPAVAVDATGTALVAWYDSRSERIRVAASRDGRHWSRAHTLGRSAGIPSTMSVGLGRDGRGLVVTDQGLVSRPLRVGRIDVRKLTRHSD